MTHVGPPKPDGIRPLPQAKERTSEVHQATRLTKTEHISGFVPLESWCTAALCIITAPIRLYRGFTVALRLWTDSRVVSHNESKSTGPDEIKLESQRRFHLRGKERVSPFCHVE